VSALMTIDQAAKMLACTPAAIKKWLYQRRLTPVKIGRLTRLRLEDIERVMADGLPEPGTACQPRRRASSRPQEPRSGVSNSAGQGEGTRPVAGGSPAGPLVVSSHL
jgi:excisionase family DNA binding protein